MLRSVKPACSRSCEANRRRRYSFPASTEYSNVVAGLDQIAGAFAYAVLLIVDPVEMEVVRVKSGDLLETLGIQDADDLAVEMDELLLAQPLEHTIDVHRRHATGIGQLSLGDRKIKAVVFGQPGDAVAHQHFVDE